MTTPMDDRPRPTLTPIWTPYYSLDGSPRSPMRVPRTAHVYSPSPRSPKTLPTPVQPTGSHDGAMRQHERSMLERLDQRLRQDKQRGELSPTASACVSRSLSPITEGQMSARKLPSAVGSPMLNGRGPLPALPPPSSPATTFPRRQTLVAETRSMLLAGLTEDVDRRQSVPANRFRENPKAQQVMLLEQLRAWGPVYLGDLKNADVFVQAMALRRPSDASSTSEHSNADETPQHSPKVDYQPRRHSMIRARVRPRDVERKAILVERVFDMDVLRSTIPEPLPMSTEPLYRRPSQADASSPAYRRSLPGARRRSSSAARQGLQPAGLGLTSLSTRESRAHRSLGNAVPFHLEYARSHLPVLAALMVSGHVREGDIIDLPMPHPEAWYSTVAYVYTGQGDLTAAIRENIIHLAGKV